MLEFPSVPSSKDSQFLRSCIEGMVILAPSYVNSRPCMDFYRVKRVAGRGVSDPPGVRPLMDR